MRDIDFYTPQRQSKTGIILIFSATIFQVVKSFWAVGIYFIIAKATSEMLIYAGIVLAVLFALALVYSISYYYKFTFFIDEKNKAFVLNKGVFSSDVVDIPFNKIQQVNFKRNILQRVIGVYSVVVDTAGSSDKEVEIKALNKENADQLAELLMEYSAKENVEENNILSDDPITEPKVAETAQWEYKLGFSRLILLGLTSNYFRGLSVIVAFYFTVRSQIGYDEFDVDIPSPAFTEVATTLILFLVLFVIAMLATVIQVFIKYYGLHLVKTGNGLQVEMGLRNNTKISLRDTRVQLVQVASNPLQKRLDLFKLKISVASSQDDLNSKRIEVPALPEELVEKVKDYFYGSEIIARKVLFPHKLLLFRKLFWSLIPLLIAGIILEISPFELTPTSKVIYTVIYIGVVFTYQIFAFKKIKLTVSDDFLVNQSGLWHRKKEYFEMYKLQSVSISQPIWYKKRNLVTILFHSAGGDISYPLVDRDEATSLMNYLLYKIEVTDKPWM